MTEEKFQIVINGRPVKAMRMLWGAGLFCYGDLIVPVGLPAVSCEMKGRSGILTGTRKAHIRWMKDNRNSLLSSNCIELYPENKAGCTVVARMNPDDAETVALTILEAVKEYRNAKSI